MKTTLVETMKVFIGKQCLDCTSSSSSLLLEKQEEEEEETPKQLNVHFARNLPDYKKKERERSFQQHSKQTAEEKWIETVYFPSTSSRAQVLKRLRIIFT